MTQRLKPDGTPYKINYPAHQTKKRHHFTAEIADELIFRQAQGQPLARICQDKHMPHYQTVSIWEEQYPDFGRASARARLVGTHYLAGECLIISDDPTIDPSHKRIMVDTRLQLIGHWNRLEYGNQRQITGPGGGPIQIEDRRVMSVENMTPEQRYQLMQILEAAQADEAEPVAALPVYEEGEE